jgi:hypothetical protein
MHWMVCMRVSVTVQCVLGVAGKGLRVSSSGENEVSDR